MTPPVAVVVVNHNGGDDVIECLRTVQAESASEVVVVDNASTDGSLERLVAELPEVTLVRNDTNRGFSVAANQGVRATRAEVVVLLNADALLGPGALAALAAALEARPKAAAVGALVRNPDGSVQPSKRSFPTLWQAALHGIVGLFWTGNPGTRAYVLADADLGAAQRVGWVSCSAMALRREAFEAVDGFDEAFFFFVEDVDLCKRLWDAGWEVWFEPRAEVVHAWGGTWTKEPLRFLWMHQRNLFRYVRKHRRGAWVLAYPLIALGLGLRFVLLALRWMLVRRSVPEHAKGRT